MVPSDVKYLVSVKAVKFYIKNWLPENCPVESASCLSTKLVFHEF